MMLCAGVGQSPKEHGFSALCAGGKFVDAMSTEYDCVVSWNMKRRDIKISKKGGEGEDGSKIVDVPNPQTPYCKTTSRASTAS